MLQKLSSPMLIIVACAIIAAISLFIANWIEWMVYPAMIFGAVAVLATSIMIAYVWVVRPIKELLKKK